MITGASWAVVAVVDEEIKVVLANPDVDSVVAVDAVESSVLELVVAVVVAVSTGACVRATGTTSIVAAAESAVLVVFLNGATCRNWLLIVSLA